MQRVCPREIATYETSGIDLGAALRSETCKEKWVSPTGSVKGNKTIIYEDKL